MSESSQYIQTVIFDFPVLVTSAFGIRESWRLYPHTGIDLAVDNVKAKADIDGVVRHINSASGGFELWIVNDRQRSIYCHLSKRLVANGSQVKSGQVIGITGMTGHATGPHLHFEKAIKNPWESLFKTVNPYLYILNIEHMTKIGNWALGYYKTDNYNQFVAVTQEDEGDSLIYAVMDCNTNVWTKFKPLPGKTERELHIECANGLLYLHKRGIKGQMFTNTWDGTKWSKEYTAS